MSLAEAFANAVDGPRPGPKNRIEVILDSLNDTDRTALTKYLADTAVPSATIGTVLRQNGHQVANSTISTYRRANAAKR